jgi:diacylglycerol kinase (ATP)
MKRLWSAFLSSLDGIGWAARHEVALRQELVALAILAPLSLFVSGSTWERIALVGSILALLATELVNTALEKLCDHLAPELHPNIKVVKDLGSAAVFVMILLAALIWLNALAKLAG